MALGRLRGFPSPGPGGGSRGPLHRCTRFQGYRDPLEAGGSAPGGRPTHTTWRWAKGGFYKQKFSTNTIHYIVSKQQYWI